MSSNTNFIAALIGLVVIGCMAGAVSTKSDTVEKFMGMPQRRAVVEQVAVSGQQQNAMRPDYQNMLQKPPQYAMNTGSCKPRSVESYGTANYQSMLSPRMGPAEGYRGTLRYNMPSRENMAVPEHPLTFVNMAENYSGSCKQGGGNMPFPKQSEDSNYQQALNQAQSGNSKVAVVDSLPAHTMSQIGDDGAQHQMYVIDRFMFANQKSRLNSLGDSIRGDLPIVPITSEWMRPSVRPQIDLREGALAMIAGNDNSTMNALMALKESASGGAYPNYSASNQISGQQGDGSVQFAAFY